MKKKWLNLEFLVSSKKTITIAMSYLSIHLQSHRRKVKYPVANTLVILWSGLTDLQDWQSLLGHVLWPWHILSPRRWWQIVQAQYLCLLGYQYMWYCVCPYMCVCVCVCARMCTLGRGGRGDVGVPVCTCGCVLRMDQMGTVDAEILSTRHFKMLSFKRRHKLGGIYVLYS